MAELSRAEKIRLAADPTTEPAQLDAWARAARTEGLTLELARTIATNPNTPALTLLWMHDFAGVTAMLDNPSLPLHVLTGDITASRLVDVWITWLTHVPGSDHRYHFWPASASWEKKRKVVGKMKRPRHLYSKLGSHMDNNLRFYCDAAVLALADKGVSRARVLYEIDVERRALFPHASPLPNEGLLRTLAGG